MTGVFVVTGAASGIGRATAERLAAAGARVVAADRDAPDDELAAAVAAFVRHDVTDEAGWTSVIERARELGGLDGLVNNAGISLVSALGETSLDEWRRVLDVNATGRFLGTCAAVAEQRARARCAPRSGSAPGRSTPRRLHAKRPGATSARRHHSDVSPSRKRWAAAIAYALSDDARFVTAASS